MKNIVDYLNEQQESFEREPFNPLDSLVLSSVSSFNLEYSNCDEVFEAPTMFLHDIITHSDTKLLTQNMWLEHSDRTDSFLEGLAASERYKDVRVGFYVNDFSEEAEKQFAAMSILLPDKTLYVSFRGTDASFTGWKEDFNLGVKQVLPSQVSAQKYVSWVFTQTADSMILGGHSKGGNLAEYAALLSKETLYRNIKKVYNHDGPSFLKDPSPRIHSSEYNDKLHKTVPAASPVGMILETRDDYHIVKSDSISVLQHEPFTWIIDGNDFTYLEKANKSASVFNAAFNRLIRESSTEDREKLIETLYNLFTATNTDSWTEFGENIVKNSQSVVSKTTDLDEGTKKLLAQFVTQFLQAIKDEVFG